MNPLVVVVGEVADAGEVYPEEPEKSPQSALPVPPHSTRIHTGARVRQQQQHHQQQQQQQQQHEQRVLWHGIQARRRGALDTTFESGLEAADRPSETSSSASESGDEHHYGYGHELYEPASSLVGSGHAHASPGFAHPLRSPPPIEETGAGTGEGAGAGADDLFKLDLAKIHQERSTLTQSASFSSSDGSDALGYALRDAEHGGEGE
jgi:hypothetical protein